jgi:hypothetical protein
LYQIEKYLAVCRIKKYAEENKLFPELIFLKKKQNQLPEEFQNKKLAEKYNPHVFLL